jgi:alginate O-acetyltransferase complex protein AlgI
VNTERSERNDEKDISGWILCDEDCSLRRNWVGRLQHLLTRRGFEFISLQRAAKAEDRSELPAGRKCSPTPLRGSCGEGELSTQNKSRRTVRRARAPRIENSFTDWLVLLALSLITVVFAFELPPWAFMWLLALAIFFGFKWLTLVTALRNAPKTPAARILSYLLAWPGMDARAFLDTTRRPMIPPRREWWLALAKTLAGAVLVGCGARLALPLHPLLAGWVGMIGIVIGLHFGMFHLLSLLWRKEGVDAPPLMCAPVRATSLAEFWGKRWNRGFTNLVGPHVFLPVARRVGGVPATLLVFLVSGLLHELVISLPARGGYGLPTAYFLIQGIGLFCERTRAARRFALGRGWRGWLFTVVVTAGPAYWLFHPPFVNNVILPFLKASGAI